VNYLLEESDYLNDKLPDTISSWTRVLVLRSSSCTESKVVHSLFYMYTRVVLLRLLKPAPN